MRTPARLLALVIVAAPAGLTAQVVGPVLPRATPAPQRCQEQPADSEEIVVCGQNSEDSPYRIPRALRQRQNQIEDSAMSWDARTRDMEAMERFSSANVGPSGMSQNARQRDCAWRVARQVAQGRQPDCGRRDRPDEATDWQRR